MANQDKMNFDKDLHLTKIFPYPSFEDWKTEAEKLLKGAPFDKIMKTNTCEGISLNAIYNEEDIQNIPYLDSKPGFFPFVRGTSVAKKVVQGWDVQQELDVKSIEEWNQILLKDLYKGQNSFRLKLDRASALGKKITEASDSDFYNNGLPVYNYSDFSKALKDISLENISFDIEAGCSVLPVYLMLKKFCTDNNINPQSLKGSVAGDFVKHLVEDGTLPGSMKQLLDELAEVTKAVVAENSGLKTILIDLSVWNESGSSAVDDLAIMVATVSFYASEMLERGLDINAIFSKMTFIFSVNTNLFMEISKLRAARYIFAKLAEAYGVSEENAKMRMHVKTSIYTKTVFDPWVNILRTSTEAFSAVVGGCDSLNVTPFDCIIGQSDEFSRRIARNQQIILLEEAHLNAVNDPAGGSYFVEALTYELIKKSWNYFLEIEEKGGIIQGLQSGSIQDKVNQSHQIRINSAETRKDVIVGTSTFANLQEKKIEKENLKIIKPVSLGNVNEKLSLEINQLIDKIDKMSIDNFVSALRETQDILKIVSMPKRRLAETFEDLRNKIEKIQPRPEVFVANIGKTVKNKPRVDFALGFFEPAGFNCSTNDGFDTVEEALATVLNSQAKVIVLSSTDDKYPEVVPVFAQRLKEEAPDKVLVLAGYPKEHIESFTNAGVDFFVYMRLNVVQTIKEIIRKAGL